MIFFCRAVMSEKSIRSVISKWRISIWDRSMSFSMLMKGDRFSLV